MTLFLDGAVSALLPVCLVQETTALVMPHLQPPNDETCQPITYLFIHTLLAIYGGSGP